MQASTTCIKVECNQLLQNKIPGVADMVLLIGGHPRSGTTLLRNLCNGHPEMTVTNELGSFSRPGQRYWTYSYSMLRWWWNVKNRWAFDSSYS
jgi:hypothetical protein